MLLRFLTTESTASEFIYTADLITAEQAANTGLINAVFPAKEVESAALSKAVKLKSLSRLAFAHSKNQRTLSLRREIRANVEQMIESLLDAWFGPEGQVLLRAAAQKLKR